MKYKNWGPEIWAAINQALDQELKENSSPVAAFDADGTLWDTDLGEGFFKYQIEKKLIPNLPQDPWRHYRDWKESGDPRPAYLWLAQINQGYKLDEVRNWASDFVKNYKNLPIFEDQKKLIELLIQKKVKVYVVTASVKWAVEPGARLLGLKNENVLGIQTEDINGIVTDKQRGVITYKEGKVSGLLEATKGIKPFLCLGNTMGDHALLNSATKLAIAVGAAQPGHELFETEEKLRSEAKNNNWLIHQF